MSEKFSSGKNPSPHPPNKQKQTCQTNAGHIRLIPSQVHYRNKTISQNKQFKSSKYQLKSTFVEVTILLLFQWDEKLQTDKKP